MLCAWKQSPWERRPEARCQAPGRRLEGGSQKTKQNDEGETRARPEELELITAEEKPMPDVRRAVLHVVVNSVNLMGP